MDQARTDAAQIHADAANTAQSYTNVAQIHADADNAAQASTDVAQIHADAANVAPINTDGAQVSNADPAASEPAPHAELDTAQLDYEHTALYAGINTKERRAFRAASLRQHEAYQDLVTPPERKRESLEHETLVTLDFSPNQVLELSTLILESQINECWYEYLKP